MPKFGVKSAAFVGAVIGALALLPFQNCGGNVQGGAVSAASMDTTCTPQGKPCLKYELNLLDSVAGAEYSSACVMTLPTVNGISRDTIRWSGGCSSTNNNCARCQKGSHWVSFSVLAADSKIGVNQSIQVQFPVTGERASFSGKPAGDEPAADAPVTAEEIFEQNAQEDDLAVLQEIESQTQGQAQTE